MRQARQESSEAAAAAGEAALRDTTAQHHSSSGLAAVRDKAKAVLDALRVLAKLALRTSAAMQTATASLQTASHAPSPQVFCCCPFEIPVCLVSYGDPPVCSSA